MPKDWAPVVADLGVQYLELSADTEADPMYHGRDYLRRWDEEVHRVCQRHNLTVASLYSGHGSYSTLGLLHPDEEVVRRLVDQWVKAAIDRARGFGAGLGFFFHAVAECDLHDPARYAAALGRLVAVLADITAHAAASDPAVPVSLEQMYTPNQPPWTISGTEQLMNRVMSHQGHPLYTTVDTGHAWAQRRFVPAGGAVREAEAAVPAAHLVASHLVAAPEDSDPYSWLERLGVWSPIIHLQQTDGNGSHHRPFTAPENQRGIIHPERVLTALQKSAERAARWGTSARTSADTPDPAADALISASPTALPGASAFPTAPPVQDIYLTIEVFGSTAADSQVLLQEIRESVAWWRQWIPQDGLHLSQLASLRKK